MTDIVLTEEEQILQKLETFYIVMSRVDTVLSNNKFVGFYKLEKAIKVLEKNLLALNRFPLVREFYDEFNKDKDIKLTRSDIKEKLQKLKDKFVFDAIERYRRIKDDYVYKNKYLSSIDLVKKEMNIMQQLSNILDENEDLNQEFLKYNKLEKKPFKFDYYKGKFQKLVDEILTDRLKELERKENADNKK